MKKLILTAALILIIAGILFSEEINNYPLEVMKTFPNGSGENELTVKNPYDIGLTYGPRSFSFNKNGCLYIMDLHNSKIAIYNEKYNYIDEIKGNVNIGLKLEIDKDNNLIGHFIGGLKKLQENGIISFFISVYHSEYHFKMSAYKSIVTDNIVLLQLQDKTYISIPNPTSDKENNLKKVLNPEQTIKYVNKKLNQKGVPKDERLSMKDGLIFKGDKLLTRDFKTYYKYMTEKQSKEGLQKPKKTNTNLDVSNFYEMGYLGEDNGGYTYWDGGSSIIVYNKNGYVIDFFGYDGTMFDQSYNNGMGCVFPVIHPNGDVYFLGYDFTESKLYRIKRRWFSPAIITEKEIKLKNTPSLSDKEIGEPIKKKTEVEVLERNDDKTTIDKKEEYWYKVKTGSNEGWIFGGYIEFVE